LLVQVVLVQPLTALRGNQEVIQQFPEVAQHYFRQTEVVEELQLPLVLVEQEQQLVEILVVETVVLVVKKLQLKTVAVVVLVDILEMVV
jgi:hypothetical protein